MVEEADTSMDVIASPSIEHEPDPDLGFAGRSLDDRTSHDEIDLLYRTRMATEAAWA